MITMGAQMDIPHWLPELLTMLVVIGVAWGVLKTKTDAVREAFDRFSTDTAEQAKAYATALASVQVTLAGLQATVQTLVSERAGRRDSLVDDIEYVRAAVHDVRNRFQEICQDLLDRVSRLEGYHDGSMSGAHPRKGIE